MYPHLHTQTSLSYEVLKKYSSDYFIETGCNTGLGIENAIKVGFKEIISLDIEERFVNICKNKFSSQKNINVYQADSSKDLFNIIENINDQITFWLDGHGYYSVPLLSELRQIKLHNRNDHILLIDDMRMLGTEYWNYLSRDEIINLIYAINKDYKISYEHSPNADNDIMVCKVY